MNQYYRVIIKTSYENKRGQLKYKKESYLVYDVSPTAVEAKLASHMGTADYEIHSISLINIVDIVK